MKDRMDRSRMPMSDLIREADEREIAGAEWMDRATLVRALEAGEDRPKGILARARRFLGQVTGLDRVVKAGRAEVEREWKVGSESAGESELVAVHVSGIVPIIAVKLIVSPTTVPSSGPGWTTMVALQPVCVMHASGNG